MINRTVSVAPYFGSTLAPRPDARRHRALHRVHGIIDRVQGSSCLLDRLGRDGSLHRLSRMRGTANTARYKQPGEEAHLDP
jgi:hypothetical protein